MKRIKSILFRPGILNVLEHGITRASDALTSLVLIWSLPVEIYGNVAYAQALVAPLGFLFITQDVYIYRHYSRWKQSGRSTLIEAHQLMDRIVSLKTALAFSLSAVGAYFLSARLNLTIGVAFGLLVWGFCSVMLTHWLGPDRELLRMGGSLASLNRITLLQKTIVLFGVIAATRWMPNQLFWLAPLWLGSILTSKFLLSSRIREFHSSLAEGTRDSASVSFRDALFGMSFWNHISGSIYLFGQTMDLFFLGTFHPNTRELSLYSVALKYSTFCTFLPYALANTFNIQVGNASPGNDGVIEQRDLFRRAWPRYFLAVAAQTLVFVTLAPWIFQLSGRGKWSATDQFEITQWFRLLVIAQAIHVLPLLWWVLSQLRTPMKRITLQIYAPWGVLGLLIYAWAAQSGTPLALAQMNIVHSIAFAILVFVHHRREDPEFYSAR